jgi:hypothetical protein
MTVRPAGQHPQVRPGWDGQTSGGGWNGEAAKRQAGRLIPAVGPRNRVDGGGARGKEHGEQDHQEDDGGQQHGFTYISLIGLDWEILRRLLIRDRLVVQERGAAFVMKT